MRYLIDTHVLLWWLFEAERLSQQARETIQDRKNQLVWSAASTWEASIKASLGKLKLPGPAREFIPKIIEEEGLIPLSIHHAHAAAVQDLPHHHGDPFDRLLIAQAQLEEVPILSGDRALRLYDVPVHW